MKELQNQGIISVVKHFPGHGATKQDTHYFLPKVKEEIEEDMYPFEQAIKEGADAILISHLVIKNVTYKLPASLSRRFITKYLRKKYRYNGLIITDDLKMKAIKFIYGTDKAVIKAFGAGNDIIIFRLGTQKCAQIMNKITGLVYEKKLKESRIDKSVRRIIKMKQKYGISDEQIINPIDIEDLNKEIKLIREKL